MGIINRIVEAFRSGDYDEYEEDFDEEYDYDDEEYDDEEDYDDYEEETQPVKSASKRKNNDYYKDEADHKTARTSSRSSYTSSKKSNITPLRRNMELTLVSPTEMSDAQKISNHLLDGKAVVLNMEGIMQTDLAQRILDFTSGSTYTLNGKLQKVSNAIFVVTPSSVDLSGDFQGLINPESHNESTNLNVRMS
jgi:cell division protein sepF